ncbi:hypothetical protein BS329_16975 [Amycolatopsis coloradensis]|uniref:diacylglycerol O-acyltransferase n=1 Tax=Amycolatopsis coloradensis TaxID=76021 RepID=A0A1R0KTV4_9PSEU|nr:wax ester/triacylglycerol synthase domain-containing protein [Amycolatopsis coloradensis]OLZ51473.1 hypothetical protein BS329_16975 [Amycolatopsis coloradensis]
MSNGRHDGFVGSDAWGAARRMNGLDTVMWRAEVDPLLRSTVMAVYTLDRVPPWADVVAEHERIVGLVPRLAQRVSETRLGVGNPGWRHDTKLDLDYHVRRVRLPEPADHGALLMLAQTMACTPFDRRRPLWEAVLAEGLNGDQAGYVLKLHHSSMDGAALMCLDALMHPPYGSDRPQPGLSLVRKEDDETERRARPAGSIGALAAVGGKLLGHATGALRHPSRAVREGSRLAESLVHVFSRPAVAPSPLLRGRAGSWRFVTVDAPLSSVRSAAKAAGVSLNDAVVSAVLGGLRRYHEHFGVPLSTVAAAIPIAGGRPGQIRGGNGFSVARMAMPMGEADPVRRMRMVRELITGVRSERAGKAPALLAHSMGVLPSFVIAPVLKHTTQAHDVQISTLRGAEAPLSLAGARILRLYPFGPLPAIALSVTMHTYDGNCCFGVNFDAAAVRDPDVLVRCLQDGIDETTTTGS